MISRIQWDFQLFISNILKSICRCFSLYFQLQSIVSDFLSFVSEFLVCLLLTKIFRMMHRAGKRFKCIGLHNAKLTFHSMTNFDNDLCLVLYA